MSVEPLERSSWNEQLPVGIAVADQQLDDRSTGQNTCHFSTRQSPGQPSLEGVIHASEYLALSVCERDDLSFACFGFVT